MEKKSCHSRELGEIKVMPNFDINSESLEKKKSQQKVLGEILLNHTEFTRGSFINDKFLSSIMTAPDNPLMEGEIL